MSPPSAVHSVTLCINKATLALLVKVSQRGVETTLKLRVPGSVQVTEISMAPSLSSGSMLSETVAPVTLVLCSMHTYRGLGLRLAFFT